MEKLLGVTEGNNPQTFGFKLVFIKFLGGGPPFVSIDWSWEDVSLAIEKFKKEKLINRERERERERERDYLLIQNRCTLTRCVKLKKPHFGIFI